MRIEIYDVNTVDILVWNDLLNQSTIKDVFQTYEWAVLMKNIYGHQPIFLIISDKKVIGGQLLFRKNVFFFLKGYEALGGPLYVDNFDALTIQTIINFYRNIGGPFVAYKLIRPQCPHNFENEFEQNKFLISPFQTFLLDLGPTIDNIWNGFKKNAKSGIKKAQKLNFNIIDATRLEDWKLFYELYKYHAKTHGYPAHPAEFILGFREFFIPKNMVKLFIAMYDSKIIAGMVFLICGDIMVYYIGVSESRYPSINDLLMWHAIQWGKENNIKTLNLEDTYPKKDSNLYGIHKFKEKWGGQLVKRDFYVDGKLYSLGRSLVLDITAFQKVYAFVHERRII